MPAYRDSVLRNLGIIVPDPVETDTVVDPVSQDIVGKGLNLPVCLLSCNRAAIGTRVCCSTTTMCVSTAPLSLAMRLLFLVPLTAAFSTLPRPAPYEPPDGLDLRGRADGGAGFWLHYCKAESREAGWRQVTGDREGER